MWGIPGHTPSGTFWLEPCCRCVWRHSRAPSFHLRSKIWVTGRGTSLCQLWLAPRSTTGFVRLSLLLWTPLSSCCCFFCLFYFGVTIYSVYWYGNTLRPKKACCISVTSVPTPVQFPSQILPGCWGSAQDLFWNEDWNRFVSVSYLFSALTSFIGPPPSDNCYLVFWPYTKT